MSLRHLVLLLAITMSSSLAHADRTIALIVTSNRGSTLDRPELQYADDDGAKYRATFRTIAADADVHLLTRFDHDSTRLFPELARRVSPPTRAALAAATEAIARDVAAERARGNRVDFYFVFAGHGDVEEGLGFLELEDGRFDSAALEAMLRQIAPTRAHVILDSCNSFFVLNARKPGGHRFATPEDVVRSLGQRLPDVGVFLSTSAEAEVYEWSELQSGIFSHAVRSGLAGAADANGDGAVSYEELAAFVDTASADIKNPAYRPKVYARGPGGKSSAPLFSLATATATRLTLDRDTATRLTIRDREGLRWIDLNKEAGADVTLRLPATLADGTVEEYELPSRKPRVVRRLTTDESAAVATLAPAAADESATRGPADRFHALFDRPFGPHAFAAYQAAALHAPPAVFGISRDDTDRMQQMLSHVGDLEHRGRIFGGTGLVGIGVGTIGLGAWIASDAGNQSTEILGYTLAGVGAGALVGGVIALVRRSDAERLRDEFMDGLAAGQDPATVVARTEDKLGDLARDYRRTRKIMLAGGIFAVGAGLTLTVLNERDPSPSLGNRLAFGGLALAGTLAIVTSRFEYPIESMVRLWSHDPGIRRLPRWSIDPLAGGAAFSVSGSF
ncbi:MAG: hypothetical protein HOV81_15205 [Kofleriaceae bacterium]|nr:hypothetical protein [Kofleriaceae bacterium]